MDKNQDFWNNIFPQKINNDEAYKNLSLIAQEWENEKNYIYAGIVWEYASDYSSQLSIEKLLQTHIYSVSNFEKEISKNNSHERNILSYVSIISNLSSIVFYLKDKEGINNYISLIKDQLASYLVRNYTNSNKEIDYLIKGFSIRFDFFNNFEYIDDNGTFVGSKSWGGGVISKRIYSAFELYKSIPDYKMAEYVIKGHEEQLDSYELKGWNYVVKAHSYPDKAGYYLKKASEQFLKDTAENNEISIKGNNTRSWSGINAYLWGPYFHSRSLLANAVQNEEDIKKSIIDSISLIKDLHHGFVNSQVMKYRIILLFLAHLIDSNLGYSINTTINEYKSILKNWGKEQADDDILEILTQFNTVSSDFDSNPDNAIISYEYIELISKLDKLSYFSESMPKIVREATGSYMIEKIIGKENWIYRALEKIENEDVFRKIFVRLLQNLAPHKVDNVHGTNEHGKDIIYIKKNNEEISAEIFQAKIGDINTSSWRVTKPQLEEIFEVMLPENLRKLELVEIKGILLFNGKVKPVTVPKMEGWRDVKKEQGMNYEFWDIDDIVNFIISNKLIGELRISLKEYSNIET